MTASRHAAKPEDGLRTHIRGCARRPPAGSRTGTGETVKAYISLRPGAEDDPGAFPAYCKERLAACKNPRDVEILPDLPKPASGKILRRELGSWSHDNQ